MTATVDASIKSTEAFISENPIDIRLVRMPRVKTSAGGYTNGAPVSLPPQRVRLVSQQGYLADLRLSDQGDVSVPRFVVIGVPGTDMKKGDTFTHEGTEYKINRINTSPPYAIRGEAFEHVR